MRPHREFFSHTDLGLPVEKPVGTSTYVSKCISSLSQGKSNENEMHSLMKIQKKGKIRLQHKFVFPELQY